MIGKKINQLATELAPVSTDLTIIGDPTTGVSKKITLAQLGAIFSGAVSFYTNLAGFPAVGDINVIYCAKDTKKLYLWSGSAYTEVFPSQALLDTYQLRSEKGNANGYASLDSSGKVPISQLPSSIMEYKGTWNAATNTPTLANGTGDTGDVYLCNAAGTVNFGAGPLTFAVGDYVVYSGTIWQRSSGAVGTVTSVAATITGNSIGITGSPVTTSGTLALAFAGTSSQYINGAGNLTTFPTLTGYVPYTGATANVDLGTYDLTADFITASRGSYTSSGGGNTLEISHTSGSGIALNITKGGNGEGLYINKTSGSGNAATIVGTLEATTLVKTGGTSSQFLKADGSVDSSTYVTTDTFQNISASKTFSVGLSLASAGGANQLTSFVNTNSIHSGSAGTNIFGFNNSNNIYFGKGLSNGGVITYNNAAVRFYALPDASGTIALVGGSGVGTVTNVAALSLGTTGTDLNSTVVDSTTTPVITLNVPTASATNRGALSSTDWSTFNNKQNALTNPVTGTGTTNYLPKFTGTSTIGNSGITDDGTTVTYGAGSGLKQIYINGGGYDLILGASGGGMFGFSSTNASLVFSTTAKPLGIGTSAAQPLVFGTSQLERIRLDASGNLGLGVTPSSWLSGYVALEMGSGSLVYPANSANTQLWNNLYINTSGNVTYKSTGIGGLFSLGGGGNTAVWYSAPSGTSGTTATLTQAMTLNASGNLSIGNTNDTYKLDVSGTGRFTGAVSINGGSDGLFIYQNGGGASLPTYSANTDRVQFAFKYAQNFPGSNNYTRTLDIVSTGDSTGGGMIRLFTTVNNSTPSASLVLASTGAATFSSSVTTGGNVLIPAGSGLAWSGDASRIMTPEDNVSGALIQTPGIIRFNAGGSERMRITSGGDLLINKTSLSGSSVGVEFERNSTTRMTTDGNSVLFLNRLTSDGTIVDIRRSGTQVGTISVTSSATAYNTSSDYRLKTDFKDFSGLDLVSKIKAYDYEWKSDKSRSYGVIAHELQSVINYAVTGVKDGEQMQGVDYSKIVPVLIKAIQEQQQQIEQLKNK